MPRFIFDMPADMTALVEAHRIKRGYKATAVAVRELISTGLEVARTPAGVVFERDASPLTASGDALDHFGRDLRLRRTPGETDAVFRPRVLAATPAAIEAAREPVVDTFTRIDRECAEQRAKGWIPVRVTMTKAAWRREVAALKASGLLDYEGDAGAPCPSGTVAIVRGLPVVVGDPRGGGEWTIDFESPFPSDR